MLVEEGFEVVSCDASDKMLKYALKERWNRRKETNFDKWGMNQVHTFMTCYFQFNELAIVFSLRLYHNFDFNLSNNINR